MNTYDNENNVDMDVDMDGEDADNEDHDDDDHDDDGDDNSDEYHSENSGSSNQHQYAVQRVSRPGTGDYRRSYLNSDQSDIGSDEGGNMIDSVDMGYGDDGTDLGYEPAAPSRGIDLGYEPYVPSERRGSMTAQQEKERRASIKAVLADTTLSPMTKRRSIQHLMDGRRNSMTNLINATSNMLLSAAEDDSGCVRGADVRGRRNSYHGGSMMNGGDSVVGNGFTSNGNNKSSINKNPTEQNQSATTDEYNNSSQQHVCETINEQNTGSRGSSVGYYAFSNDYTKYAEQTRPPCQHYVRNCTIIAACCGAAFGCRICHDDCPNLPPKLVNNTGRKYNRSASLPSSFISMDQESTEHTIDRFAIAEVICRLCFTRQSSKTNKCVNCQMQFGEYHCNICNLWMSADESPYHCKDCGFCRVGGSENFKHCHSCGMCIDVNLIETHNCKAGKYRSNCPVCQEYLFSSRGASHEMPCGHAIHWECFRQLAAHDSRCPLCKKTAETRDRMMPTWEAIAASISLQPIPPELARVVTITCYDCETSEDARAWHFLGMQCSKCQSFNTVVEKIHLTGEEAHEFLETNAKIAAAYQQRQQYHHAQQQLQQQQAGDGTNANVQTNSTSEQEDPDRPRRRRVNRRRSAF